jgi:anti-anti-sigma regulatory factor
MVKFAKIKHLYHVRRSDFILAIVALLAVLTFETLEALLIAVIVSLIALVLRASQPRLAILGRAPDSLEFSDIHRHPENKTVPGLLIVRPENGLFFANAAGIRETILSEMQSTAEPVKAVLIDLGATTDLDVPSADMLGELSEELHSREIRFMMMRMITPVRQMLERSGVLEKIKPQDIFTGPGEAVLDYLSTQYDEAGILELPGYLCDCLIARLVPREDGYRKRQPFAPYGTQLERTTSSRSAAFGSLVGRCTRKSCGPPISPCIMNSRESVVLSPGWRTIEPMVGVGGQHPSFTST